MHKRTRGVLLLVLGGLLLLGAAALFLLQQQRVFPVLLPEIPQFPPDLPVICLLATPQAVSDLCVLCFQLTELSGEYPMFGIHSQCPFLAVIVPFIAGYKKICHYQFVFPVMTKSPKCQRT